MSLHLPSLRVFAFCTLSFLSIFSVGCDQTPADLREWQPSDHSGTPGTGDDPGPALASSDPLVNARALWTVHCVGCHGREGRGDGAQATTRPPDMSTAAFQSTHSDEQLSGSIARGKNGTMPAFGSTLRPEALGLMVQLIRHFAQ